MTDTLKENLNVVNIRWLDDRNSAENKAPTSCLFSQLIIENSIFKTVLRYRLTQVRKLIFTTENYKNNFYLAEARTRNDCVNTIYFCAF